MLKIDVPDLTRIAQRHDGEFLTEQVRHTIDGRFERPAHGLPYMPVWGLKFHDGENAAESTGGDSIVDRLVTYLRSIQEE
jgi:hypothetical protein